MSLFSFIGKVASGAAHVATGLIPGTLDDRLLGAVESAFKGGPATNRPVNTTPINTTPIRRAVTLAAGTPSLFPTALPTPDSIKVQGGITSVGPGGSIYTGGQVSGTAYFSPGVTTMPGVQSGASTALAQCGTHLPRGTHPNKTGYYTKQGFVPAGSRCVKNRRRNALNPRALSRAVSRVAAAKHYAKMLDRIEIKHHGKRR